MSFNSFEDDEHRPHNLYRYHNLHIVMMVMILGVRTFGLDFVERSRSRMESEERFVILSLICHSCGESIETVSIVCR